MGTFSRRAVYVGCCGLPRRLEEYARHFPVVEVQQTFYRLPRRQTVERWRARVPPPFEFTLKAWQVITHPPSSPTYRRLGRVVPERLRTRYGSFAPSEEVLEAWEQTRGIAQALRASMVLFQCPARFTPERTHIANLRRFFTRIERGALGLAWEPRGPWPADLVAGLCRELDLIHCVDPLAGRSVYGRPRYYRLHGRTGYRYRFTEEDLNEVRRSCVGPTYVFFNNIAMWEDARRFARILLSAPRRVSGGGG